MKKILALIVGFFVAGSVSAQVLSTLWETDDDGTRYMTALIHVPEIGTDVKYICYTDTDNPLASTKWSWKDNDNSLSPTVKNFMTDFGIALMYFSIDGGFYCNYRDKKGKYWFGVYIGGY